MPKVAEFEVVYPAKEGRKKHQQTSRLKKTATPAEVADYELPKSVQESTEADIKLVKLQLLKD